MDATQKKEITEAYRRLESLLIKYFPYEREGSISSIRADVYVKLAQSRFTFEVSWDEHEDQHLETV